jgi:hypothetical protein
MITIFADQKKDQKSMPSYIYFTFQKMSITAHFVICVNIY